jgi:hypothetical protein
MIELFQDPALLTSIVEFARGGGGGSGGGGGGGGGGSGGGGGGSIIFMIGYLPAYFVTERTYKHISAKLAYILGALTGIAVTTGMAFISGGLAFLVAIGAAVGIWSGTHNLLTRIAKKIKLSRKTIDVAAQTDPAWNLQYLETQVRETFPKYQQDWSAFDLDSIRTYTSPRYFEHVRLLLAALRGLGRQNVVAQPHINDWAIVDAHNDDNDDLDGFTAFIKAGAVDNLVSMADNRVIYTDSSTFEEYWRFDRDGDRWVLDGIRQATENSLLMDSGLQQFADKNGMYYSPDMGYLLLPERGQLFGKANFKRSDINNHVIGEWEGLLVQLYTYVPFSSRERSDNYLVGQISLPKVIRGHHHQPPRRPVRLEHGRQRLPTGYA